MEALLLSEGNNNHSVSYSGKILWKRDQQEKPYYSFQPEGGKTSRYKHMELNTEIESPPRK